MRGTSTAPIFVLLFSDVGECSILSHGALTSPGRAAEPVLPMVVSVPST